MMVNKIIGLFSSMSELNMIMDRPDILNFFEQKYLILFKLIPLIN